MPEKTDLPQSSLRNSIMMTFLLVIIIWGVSLTPLFQYVVRKTLIQGGVDPAVVQKFAKQFLTISTGLTLAAMAITLIIAIFISKAITRDLGKLEEGAAEIARGRLDVKIAVDSQDEIGHLAESFNTMAEKVRKFTEDLQREIVERKRAEDRWRESEEKYRALAENSQDVIMRFDRELRHTYVNPAVTRVTSLSPDDFIGKTHREVGFPLNLCVFWEEQIQKVFDTGKPHRVEFELDAAAGKVIFEWLLIPEFTPEKTVETVLGVSRDITKRKRMELALRESEKRFQQVAENSEEWIWEVDVEGIYTYASPVVERILGYKPEELVGKKHFYDLFQPEEGERLKKVAFEVFAQKQPFREFVNRNINKEGDTVWLSTSGVPILDDQRNLLGYRGSDIDITEKKKIETMKDNLIRDVSHSLKTPIAVMEMACAMGQRAVESRDMEAMKNAQRITIKNLGTLSKDVNNILELFVLGREGAVGEREYFSLTEILDEIISDLKYHIEDKKLRVRVTIPDGADKVLASKRELRTLFYNIIDNAVKFTRRGTISITGSVTQKCIQIMVEDTGEGIAPAEKDLIFKSFYKRDSAFPGTGLGLSICKEIIELCGGKIEVSSKGRGKGTTITVTFPMK